MPSLDIIDSKRESTKSGNRGGIHSYGPYAPCGRASPWRTFALRGRRCRRISGNPLGIVLLRNRNHYMHALMQDLLPLNHNINTALFIQPVAKF